MNAHAGVSGARKAAIALMVLGEEGSSSVFRYLHEDEITELNRIVVMFLDFAEDQARRRRQIFLRDWETRLDDFLRFNDRDVLGSAGSISKAEADEHARGEYEQFAAHRRALMEAEGERAAIAALQMTMPVAMTRRRSRWSPSQPTPIAVIACGTMKAVPTSPSALSLAPNRSRSAS